MNASVDGALAPAPTPRLLDVRRVQFERLVGELFEARWILHVATSCGDLAVIRTVGAERLETCFHELQTANVLNGRRTAPVRHFSILAHVRAASALDPSDPARGVSSIMMHLTGGKGAPQHVLEALSYRRAMEALPLHADPVLVSEVVDEHFAPGTALAEAFCTVRDLVSAAPRYTLPDCLSNTRRTVQDSPRTVQPERLSWTSLPWRSFTDHSCACEPLQVCGVEDIAELRVPVDPALFAHLQSEFATILARESAPPVSKGGVPLEGQFEILFDQITNHLRHVQGTVERQARTTRAQSKRHHGQQMLVLSQHTEALGQQSLALSHSLDHSGQHSQALGLLLQRMAPQEPTAPEAPSADASPTEVPDAPAEQAATPVSAAASQRSRVPVSSRMRRPWNASYKSASSLSLPRKAAALNRVCATAVSNISAEVRSQTPPGFSWSPVTPHADMDAPELTCSPVAYEFNAIDMLMPSPEDIDAAGTAEEQLEITKRIQNSARRLRKVTFTPVLDQPPSPADVELAEKDALQRTRTPLAQLPAQSPMALNTMMTPSKLFAQAHPSSPTFQTPMPERNPPLPPTPWESLPIREVAAHDAAADVDGEAAVGGDGEAAVGGDGEAAVGGDGEAVAEHGNEDMRTPQKLLRLPRWLSQKISHLKPTYPRLLQDPKSGKSLYAILDDDSRDNPAFWGRQKDGIRNLIMLVEAAGSLANTPVFAKSVIDLVGALVDQLRSAVCIAGLELLMHPTFTAHPAIVMEGIALISQKSKSADSKAVRKRCDEAMSALVMAQPNKHALQALNLACTVSRSNPRSYPALPTVAKGIHTFVEHNDGQCLASIELIESLASLLVVMPGDPKETKEEAKEAVVKLAAKNRESFERVLQHTKLSTHTYLKIELHRRVDGPNSQRMPTGGRARPWRTPIWMKPSRIPLPSMD